MDGGVVPLLVWCPYGAGPCDDFQVNILHYTSPYAGMQMVTRRRHPRTVDPPAYHVECSALGFVWHPRARLAVGPSFEPGGAVFAVYVLLVVSTAAGAAVARAPPMPALAGQLLVGFLLRNLPGVGPAVGGAVDDRCSASARTAALGVILARAGLALDVPAMWRLKWPASRLACAPATAEALVVTLVSKPLLGLPWGYAATLGFLFSAVSPSVVIPSVLTLQEKGFGTEAGVTTLVVTAASINVVYSIAGFGVASSLVVGGEGGAVEAAWRAPVQLIAGAVFGAAVGTVLGAVTASSTETVPPNSSEIEEDEVESTSSSSESTLRPAIGLLGLALAVLFTGARVRARVGYRTCTHNQYLNATYADPF